MAADRRLEQQVSGIIREVLQVEVPGPDADLIETGLIDSLGLVALITELEVALGFELPLEELDVEQFRTVGLIAAFIGRFVPSGDVARSAR